MKTHRILLIVFASLSGAALVVGPQISPAVGLWGLLAGGVACGLWLVHQINEGRRRQPIPAPTGPPPGPPGGGN